MVGRLMDIRRRLTTKVMLTGTAVVRNRMPGGVGERREQSRLLPDSAISALMAESSYGHVQPTEFSLGRKGMKMAS